jgi:hypothetical protein
MPVLGQQEQTTFRPRPCHDPKTGVKSPRVSPLPIARLVPQAVPLCAVGPLAQALLQLGEAGEAARVTWSHSRRASSGPGSLLITGPKNTALAGGPK